MNDLIIGSGGGGKGDSGSASPVESPDTLKSTSYAEVLDLLCEGKIVGLVNGLQSIYINDTPVHNPDGTSNFEDSEFQFTFRNGTQDQEMIPGFAEVSAEIPVGREVKSSQEVTEPVITSAESTVDKIRVTIDIPALVKYEDNGDTNGSSVQFRIDVIKNGDGASPINKVQKTIEGKTTSNYQLSFLIDLPRTSSSDFFSIRVTKQTTDSTTLKLQNTIKFSSYTKISNTKLRYPNSVLCGLRISSAQFNSIPKRGYHVKLLEVKIPTNYDPVYRSYIGHWDGTFKTAWTNNPAWCYYDLITNERYGLGEYISEELVDKWSLYTISKYCDEEVPTGFKDSNGNDTKEPRFTLNTYIQTRQDAVKLLYDIASAFRGMIYWGNGTLTVEQDSSSSTPVLQFTNSNVIDGLFTYSGASKKVIHTAALVTWNDPEAMYQQRVEYVEDREGIDRYGYNPTEIVAFGCTSRGQAVRAGNWLLYTERVESNVVSFTAGLDSVYCTPGSIIKVFDEPLVGVKYSGRVVSIVGNIITLDREVTVPANQDYKLRLSHYNPGYSTTNTPITSEFIGSNFTYDTDSYPIMTGITNGKVVTINATPSNIEVGSIWTIYSDNADENLKLNEKLYRVVSLKEADSLGTYEIVGMLHNPDKFAYIENSVALEERVYSTLSRLPEAVDLASVVVTSGTYTDSYGTIRTSLAVGFKAALYASSYTLQIKRASGTWEDAYVKKAELNYTFYGLQPGERYSVKIIPLNIMSNPGPSTVVNGLYIANEAEDISTGAKVNNFRYTLREDDILLQWDAYPVPGDVRYSIYKGATFETSAVQYSGLTAREKSINETVVATHTYWLVATVSGVSSVPAKLDVIITAPLPVVDVIGSGEIEQNTIYWSFQEDKVDLVYTQIYASSTADPNIALNDRTQSSFLANIEYPGETYTHLDLDDEQTVYYWLRVYDTRGNHSIWYPFGAEKGLRITTRIGTPQILGLIANEISTSELSTDLNDRIDKVDQVLIPNLNPQLRHTEGGLVDVATLLTNLTVGNLIDIKKVENVTAQDAYFNAEAALEGLLAAENTRLGIEDTIGYYRQELTEDFKEGLYAEATLREVLAAKVNTDKTESIALIEGIESSLATDIAAEALARNTLAVQFRGDYTGNDVRQLSSGLLFQESSLRVSDNQALGERITVLSAGIGEQFDNAVIWYFDGSTGTSTDLEGWTGSSALVTNLSYLRFASSTYAQSPTISIDANKYSSVKLRVKRVGTPTWGGTLYGTIDGVETSLAIDEPEFDGAYSIIDIIPEWTGTLQRIKIKLAATVSLTEFYEIDWIAVGRPSPGASSAQIAEINNVSATSTSATARAVAGLEASVFNETTGLAKATASIDAINDIDVTSTSASARAVAGLAATVFDEETGLAKATASIDAINEIDVTSTSASARAVAGLAATVFDEETGLAKATAAINDINNVSADSNSAIAKKVSSLEAIVYDEETGLPELIASIANVGEVLAQADTAIATTNRQLVASSLSAEELALANIIGREEEYRSIIGTAAILREELSTDIKEGISAQARATTTLNAKVDSNLATLQTDYYTKTTADAAISSATTALKSSMEGPVGSIGGLSSTLQNDYYTKTAADSAISTATTTLKSSMEGPTGSVGSLSATLQNDYYTKTAADTAISSASTVLRAAVDDDLDDVVSQITDTQKAVATANTAAATTRRELVASSLTSDEQALANILNTEESLTNALGTLAVLREELSSDIVEGISAQARATTTLNAKVDSNLATLQTDYYTKTDTNSAISTATTTLTSKVGEHDTTIKAHTSSIDGIKGEYRLTIDNNGKVSGFGLYSSPNTSSFQVSVDNFAVTVPESSLSLVLRNTSYNPGNCVKTGESLYPGFMLVCKAQGTTGNSPITLAGKSLGDTIRDGTVIWQVASKVPFYISTSGGSLEGSTLYPGTYIDGATILSATINEAHIVDGTISNAKIGEYIKSTNFSDDNINEQGVITNIGTSGWAIDKTGKAVFNDVFVRGTVVVGEDSEIPYEYVLEGPPANATVNNFEGTWASNISYVWGDIVTYKGSSWSCVLANIAQSPPDREDGTSSYWILYGAQGVSYKVEITSSNGNIFKTYDNASTMLTIKVYRNSLDITSEIGAEKFNWRRVSLTSDPLGDEHWNNTIGMGTKTINLTAADVLNKATFFCDLME